MYRTSFHQDYLSYIVSVIRKHFSEKDFRLYLFGSRARNTHNVSSDYDIAIEGKRKLTVQEKMQLQSLFEDAPFEVDIIDTNNITKKTLDLIKLQSWKEIL